jgi:hypothetical protein
VEIPKFRQLLDPTFVYCYFVWSRKPVALIRGLPFCSKELTYGDCQRAAFSLGIVGLESSPDF